MEQDLLQAGLVAIFGMVVSLLPFGVAVVYMLRPSERLLALMRPLSLATISSRRSRRCCRASPNVFRTIPKSQTATGYDVAWIAHGLSETFTPNFVAFSFLTAAWLRRRRDATTGVRCQKTSNCEGVKRALLCTILAVTHP